MTFRASATCCAHLNDLNVMIFRLPRALLKSVISDTERQSGLCRSRPISTKSAIHTALKSRPRDGFRTGKVPRDPPRSQNSMQRESGPGHSLKGKRFSRGDQGETRQKVWRPQENYQDKRSKRESPDIHPKPRGLRRSSFSTRGDDLSSYASAPHSRESRRSGRRDGDYLKAFESATGRAPLSKPFKADTWSSHDEFLPNEEPSELDETLVTQRGASRSDLPRRSEKDFIGNSRYDVGGRTSDEDSEDVEPLRLPYTTPASEFLYGRSVVAAALRARRRKFYKLYIYQSPKREADKNDLEMRKMALDQAVPVERVSFDKLQMLDRMSEGRPHNVSLQHNRPLMFWCIVHSLMDFRVSYWRHRPYPNSQSLVSIECLSLLNVSSRSLITKAEKMKQSMDPIRVSNTIALFRDFPSSYYWMAL